jgi:hypothetical protein
VRPPPQLVRLAGRQVAVEDAGPASGFPVIVHHGGTGTCSPPQCVTPGPTGCGDQL